MGIFTTALDIAYYSDSQCNTLLKTFTNSGCNSIPTGTSSWKLECDEQDCTSVAFYDNPQCESSAILQLDCPCADSMTLGDNGSCISASNYQGVTSFEIVYVLI
jgi:hypothetical protein